MPDVGMQVKGGAVDAMRRAAAGQRGVRAAPFLNRLDTISL
jgi:hypothetical protein